MQIFRVVSFWLMIVLTVAGRYIAYTVPMKIAIIISMILVVINIVMTLKGAYRRGKEDAVSTATQK